MITLKTLAQATAQQVFDQAVGGVLRQGAPAIQASGTCAYRVHSFPQGTLACAAGQLMSDEEAKNLPNGGWSQLLSWRCVPSEHALLICDLQTAHDLAALNRMREDFIPAFVRIAQAVAAKYGLSVAVLNAHLASEKGTLSMAVFDGC